MLGTLVQEERKKRKVTQRQPKQKLAAQQAPEQQQEEEESDSKARLWHAAAAGWSLEPAACAHAKAGVPVQDSEKVMEQIRDVLEQRQRVLLLPLILSHTSFAQTVENLFALAFLVSRQLCALMCMLQACSRRLAVYLACCVPECSHAFLLAVPDAHPACCCRCEMPR